MLRRLSLRDFVIVPALEVEFGAGFSVLTGETGAGKSILVDALQLALGSRGDVGVVQDVKAFHYGNVSVVGLLVLKTVYTLVGLVV